MLHGLLLLDKPKDWTSHDLVHEVRKVLGESSVGHCGTLDPLATGLMVLLVGQATKLSSYILERDKTYLLRGELGLKTDTLDRTGTVIQRTNLAPNLTTEKVREQIQLLCGELMLDVPLFSATKVAGKKLYEYARKGEEPVNRPEKKMSFTEFKNIQVELPYFELEMRCTKGSFVRSWVSLLGERLGCGAVLTELRRTRQDPFDLNQAMDWESWKTFFQTKSGFWMQSPNFVPLVQALSSYPSVWAIGREESLILNGQIGHGLKSQLISGVQAPSTKGEIFRVISKTSGQLLALVGFDQEKGFQIKRVFRL